MNVSYLRSYTDTLPTVTTLNALAKEGNDGARVAALTESYRQTGSKAESPLFAVACLFDDGKAKDNITALTGLSLVDIDYVFSDECLVETTVRKGGGLLYNIR